MDIIKIDGSNYHAIKSTQLLVKCKNIFGIAIEAAYIVDDYKLEGDSNCKYESIHNLRSIHTKLAMSRSTATVQFDTDDIILEFKGGNHVLFSGSELALFKKIDLEKVK